MKNGKNTCLLAALFLSLLMLSACRHVEKVETSEPIRVQIMAIDTVRSGMVRTYVGEVEEKTSLPLGFAAMVAVYIAASAGRWKLLVSPKGFPLADTWHYRRKFHGRVRAAVSCLHVMWLVLSGRR